ncbi:MAG: putative glutathione S-transferase-related transrane protein [Hyphomicrobiales bacterium]|nr:putative glutathione S-transferase-related transrane protein [Hyphomicrobiales bacterium]
MTTLETAKKSDDLRIEPSASEPTVVITRTLKAPRALVWKMVSEPEHLIRWWGPHGYDNTVKEFDFRVGGKWKIESRPPDGRVFNFIGEYLEIVPPERLVQTFGVEGMFDGKFAVDSLTLTEVDGKTIYSVVSRFDTAAERDGMLASDMEHGVRQGFERLDAMLEDLQAKN